MNKLLAISLLMISLTGCATMGDFCEVHSRGCLLTGEAVAVVVVGAIAIEATKHNQTTVIKNCNPADASCK